MTAPWACLRQVVIATSTPADDIEAMRARYRLPRGFSDPVLLDYGVADETIPIGGRRFIEFIAPVDDTSFLHPWLERTGGPAGYCLSVQVPDITAVGARCADLGVRIITDLEALGHRIMQVRSRDVSILLDLGEIPDRHEWFWDDITPGPSVDAKIDDILIVEFTVADAERAAEVWSTLLDVGRPSSTSVDLGAIVQFVSGDTKGLSAITVSMSPGCVPLDDGVVAGVHIRHVAARG